MSKCIETIKKYMPYNDQEVGDQKYFIECENIEQILTRENQRAHLTVSAFITNKEKTKVLCTYHNIYKSWTWVGGHIDGVDDLLKVIKREIKEETSLEKFELLNKLPISIESLPVASHYKRQKFVPAHTHLNVTYLFVADENQTIKRREDENKAVGWLTFSELVKKSKEPHMLSVYKKIIEKLDKIEIKNK